MTPVSASAASDAARELTLTLRFPTHPETVTLGLKQSGTSLLVEIRIRPSGLGEIPPLRAERG